MNMVKKKKCKKRKSVKKITIREPSKIYATVVSGSCNTKQVKEDLETLSNSVTTCEPPKGFSTWFGYYMVKQLDGGFDLTEGSTAWWGCRVNKGYGICKEMYYPQNTRTKKEFLEFMKVKPNIFAFEDAYRHRSHIYERINGLEDIIQVFTHNIKNKGHITLPQICFYIFENIQNTSNGFVNTPRKKEKSMGAHAVCLTGMDPKQKLFKFINSWGEEWGDKGYGYIPYEYINKYFVEGWIMSSYIPFLGHKIKWEDREIYDKQEIEGVQYEVSNVESVLNKPDMWIIDADVDRKIAGWTHFRIIQDGIELEDLYNLPEYSDYKISNQLLELVEKISKETKLTRVTYYVHVQDLLNEGDEKRVRTLFESRGFNITFDNSKFKGCYWKVIKKIN